MAALQAALLTALLTAAWRERDARLSIITARLVDGACSFHLVLSKEKVNVSYLMNQ